MADFRTAHGYRVSTNYQMVDQTRGKWVRVEEADLPVPVALRIHQGTDGRYVVTGLKIGDDREPSEITSQTLREIKLREIMADLFQDFDPDAPPDWTSSVSIVAALARLSAATGHVARTREKGPDTEALQAFARTYLAELARQPQRAMSAAAKSHDISRATANRWAQECRRLGYLPSKNTQPEEEEGDGE